VSVNKNRTKDGNFDLDLKHITDRCIAIGFPADGYEAVYRNARHEVINYLKMYHGKYVKVYNLCVEKDKQYDLQALNGFSLGKFPFSDH
jgi:phosphatidylinositol-3,4,5-trisphosphate 3-phosphatase/dual-specificity protein phosphatase PTEN